MTFSPLKFAITAASFAAVTTIATAIAPAAQAISLSSNTGAITGYASGTIDFNSTPTTTNFTGLTQGIATLTSDVNAPNNQIVASGSNRSLAIIGSNNGGGNPGSVTFTFSNQLNFFGFQWINGNAGGLGNKVVQFFNQGVQIGNNFTLTPPGTQRYYNFFVEPIAGNTYDFFNEVRLIDPAGSAGNFRIDNVAFREIPTPALLPGLVGLGMATIRQRKKADAVAKA
jgi:hypothetical protein